MTENFETPYTPMEEPKKKSNTTLIIVIVVLAILLCCCALVLLFYFYLGDMLLQWFQDQGFITLRLLLAA
jgi:flagellar basal body-associated protein FliL